MSQVELNTRTLALLVGIESYPFLDGNLQLHGTLADVEAMAALLRSRVSGLDLRILRDAQATRDGVLAAWNQIVTDARPGDEVLFYWCGHGSRVRNLTGTEVDGWDETLVPYDSGRRNRPNRDLIDDEVYAWLGRLQRKTSEISLVVDACHSGTVARSGVRNVPRDPRPRNISASHAVPSVGSAGWLPTSDRWVLLSACRDHEVAVELPIDDQVRGVFTWALEQAALSASPQTSWRDLFLAAESQVVLATYGRQMPQLDGPARRIAPLTP